LDSSTKLLCDREFLGLLRHCFDDYSFFGNSVEFASRRFAIFFIFRYSYFYHTYSTIMKFRALIAAALLLTLATGSASAQNRSLGANKLILDDGLGRTMTIQTPSPLPGAVGSNVLFTLPIPPPGNPPSGFVGVGVNPQTLAWNTANGFWAASSILTNDGVGAVGVAGTLGVSGLSTLSNTLFIRTAATTVNGDFQSVALRSIAPGTNWTGAGAFGGSSNTVILGESAGLAQIGGHNNTLSTWQNLYLNAGGAAVRIGSTTAPANTLDITGTLGVSGLSTLSNTLFIRTAATTVNGDVQSVALRSIAPGTNWTGAGAFGGSSNTVILGESAGLAQIGGHNNTLSTWQNLYLNAGGAAVRIGSTTAPANTLDITGSLGATGAVTFSGLNTLGVVHNSAAGLLSTSLVSLTADVSGILPIANGGTGSNAQNFVDLTTAQSVGGAKTFTASTVANTFASSGATITGGSINSTPIGATTTSTGAFTTLTASGSTNVGALNGTTNTFGGNDAVSNAGTTNTFGGGIISPGAAQNNFGASAATNNFGNNNALFGTTTNNIGLSTGAGKFVVNNIGFATNDVVTNNIRGNTNINTVGAPFNATAIGTGGSGTVTIGNATGGVAITSTGWSATAAGALNIGAGGSETFANLNTLGVVHNSAAGVLSTSTIVNADVNAAAAIAYSKLNLTGAIQGSDIAAGTFTTTNANIAIGNNDNTARQLRLLEPSGSGVNYTALLAQAQAADITLTMPAAAPTAGGQVLTVATAVGNNATLQWASSGAAPAFSLTPVTFAGSPHTAAASETFIGCVTSTGAIVINLPTASAAGVGHTIMIKDQSFGANTLTINATGGDQLEDATSVLVATTVMPLFSPYIFRLYSDGVSTWYQW
jgi:fibronectin-binding autotransporter adhesin